MFLNLVAFVRVFLVKRQPSLPPTLSILSKTKKINSLGLGINARKEKFLNLSF